MPHYIKVLKKIKHLINKKSLWSKSIDFSYLPFLIKPYHKTTRICKVAATNQMTQWKLTSNTNNRDTINKAVVHTIPETIKNRCHLTSSQILSNTKAIIQETGIGAINKTHVHLDQSFEVFL